MNGKSAEPAKPKLAIQPIEPVSSQGGIRRPVSFMRMGYIGPSTKPTKETATASPMRDGTSHTTSSSLIMWKAFASEWIRVATQDIAYPSASSV